MLQSFFANHIKICGQQVKGSCLLRPYSLIPFDVLFLRKYYIHSGKTEMSACLKKQFPEEEEAIEEFMRLMKVKAALMGGKKSKIKLTQSERN